MVDALTTPLPTEFRAMHCYARMSATKVRPVMALVRGRPVNEALILLRHVGRRAAPLIHKVIASAVANAERAITDKHLDVDVNALVVARVYADAGPMFKRWRTAARGSAKPIRRRTCHIRVVLRPAPAGEAGE